MTETDPSPLGATAPIAPDTLPADSGATTAVAPNLPPPLAPDPMDCPHIRTGAEIVALNSLGDIQRGEIEDKHLDKHLSHAADWVARNAAGLYTVAQALQILRGLFGRH